MRRNWKDIRSWWSDFINSQKQANNLVYLFQSLLIGISIFLLYKYWFSFIWFTFLLVLILINIFNYKCLIIGINLGIIFIISNLIFLSFINNLNNQSIDGDFKVIKTFNSSFLINYNGANILIYSKQKYELNEYLKITGTVHKINELSSFNITNATYLYINKPQIERIGTKIDQLGKIIDSNNISSYFLNLFLYGKSKNIELNETIRELNIAHFFTISGFHFGIIYLILNKLFSKIKILSNFKFSIFFSLFIYLLILGFPISAFRAFLFLLLIEINKKFFKDKYENLTILSAIAIIFILFNTNLLFNYSFVMSFTITFVILMVNKIFKNIKYYWLKTILITLCAYISSLSITITFNEKISLFGYIYQLFFMPILTVSYLVSLFFFWTKYFINYYFLVIQKIIFSLNKINVLINIKKTYILAFLIHMFLSINYNLWMNLVTLKKFILIRLFLISYKIHLLK